MKTFYIVDESVKTNCLKFIENIGIRKDVVVTIQKKPQSRSLKQNNLLHKWLSIIRDERHLSGYNLHTIDVWKEYFCQLFLEHISIEIEGKIIASRKSTTKLTVKEMADFLNKIEYFCSSELGIFLPSPQDLGANYLK